MKALVTGVAGFIGSHLRRRCSRGARVTGLDCFTDYYPRAVKERTSRPRGRTRASGSSSPRSRRPISRAARGRHARLPPGGAGRRAQELGPRLPGLHASTTSRPRRCCSKPARRRPLERLVYASSSSVYGDDVPLPMREDALPRPVSPYGVTKLAAEQLCYLYHVNHGVPAVSLRYFTVYGPRQRPDMGFHRFLRAAIAARADRGLRRRRADARLHLRRRRRRRDDRGRRRRASRVACTISEAARASR